MSCRVSRGFAVVALCAVWACAKKDTTADSAVAAAPPPPARLSDANIIALVDEANQADSAMGSLAAKMGTSADVKSFGRDMVRDHHALRQAGLDLAAKLGITPAPPPNDTIPAAVTRTYSRLDSTRPSADWDKSYIDGEVAMHQSVLALLQTTQAAAADTALKALITKAIPTIEAHLKKAQDVQTKLSSAPAVKS